MTYQMLRCDYNYMRTALMYHNVTHTVNPYRHLLNFDTVSVYVNEHDVSKFTHIRKRLKMD